MRMWGALIVALLALALTVRRDLSGERRGDDRENVAATERRAKFEKMSDDALRSATAAHTRLDERERAHHDDEVAAAEQRGQTTARVQALHDMLEYIKDTLSGRSK